MTTGALIPGLIYGLIFILLATIYGADVKAARPTGPPAPPDVLPLLSISAYEAQLQITWTIPFVTYLVVVWSDIDNFTVTTNQSIILLMNLQPNTRYQYRVVPENGCGNGSSDNGEFTTLSLSPPSPPNNVQVTTINSTTVNVSWEVPLFQSSIGTILYTSIQYEHKRSLDRLYSTSEQTVHNTTSVIGGLDAGSTYIFIICLGNKVGKGPCEEVEATTLKTAPSTPVVIAVLTNESIQISWSVEEDGGNALLYSLMQWTNHSTRMLLLSNSTSEDRQHLVDHLIPNTVYQFSVVAHSNSGDSPQGWSIGVITNPLPPGIPVSLTVAGNIIKWLPSNVVDDNNSGTFYLVELSNSPLVTNIIRTIQPTTDLTGYLVPGRYRIRVRAGNRGGLSDWSYPVMFSAIDQSTSASDQSTSASDQSTSASVSGLSSSSYDEDKVVITTVCISLSVVITVIMMMIVFFCILHRKRSGNFHIITT